MSHPFRRRRFDRFHLAALGILLVALALRVNGLNWDEGLYLHPDERFIAIVASDRVHVPALSNLGSLFDPAHSPLNPRRDGPDGKPLSFAYGSLPMYVQGVVGWVIGGLTGRDYNDYANIYRVGRPLSVACDLLTLLFTMLIARRLFGRAAALIAGALYAFAVLPIQLSHFFTVDIWLNFFVTASIYAALRFHDHPTFRRALLVGVPVGCAFATKASVPSLLAPLALAFGWALWRADDRRAALGMAAAAGLVALAVFTLFEPYALVRPVGFFGDIKTQASIVRGTWDVPFTRQFVGLTPGGYELRNLFAYGLGPAFLIAALIGVVAAGRRAWHTRDVALLLPLVWVLAYVPVLLITEARFLRYSLPLVPWFALFAGGWLASWRPRLSPRLAPAAVTVALGVTAVWALGFSNVYAHENPRIAASRWMNANIPPGSSVTAEAWDDALPLPYRGAPYSPFTQVSFDIYGDEPPEQKAQSIAATLQQVDYVVLSSDRLYLSVDNLPWRYAVQDEYYRRLLNGQLGFQLMYEAETRPELFGYRFDDSTSDESFTVYDHPRVRIFKKVQNLSAAEIHDRLLWGINQPWSPTRTPPRKQLLLAQPVESIASTGDAAWNTIAVDHAWFAILSWLVVVELFGLAALPLTASVLRRSADRGVLTTRLLGLLIVGWLGWFAASARLWSSTTPHIVVALALLAALSWGIAVRRRRAGRALPLPTPRQYLAWSSVWFGLFALFLLLRAIYPDFWQTYFGGEKPFELAYLRAISRSVWYPPYDPWFADGTINYYYYGWHLVASLIKTSGVGVSFGFQLGSATFASLFGCQIVALVALIARRGRRRIPVARAAVAGLVGLVTVELLGNLDALRQLLTLNGPVTQSFDFWQSTRVIDYTINEFPYFSELWADLHPHVINFALFALLLTLLAQLTLEARAALFSWRALALPTAIVALALGSVGVTNSWDLPLAIGLVVLTYGYAGLVRAPRLAIGGLVTGGLAVAASFALFLPFYRAFYSVVGGIGRTHSGSDLGQFLIVWGIFYAVIALALVGALTLGRQPAGDRDGALFAAITLVCGLGAVAGAFVFERVGSVPQSLLAVAGAAVVTAAAAALWRPTRLRLLLLEPIVALTIGAALMASYRPAATVALAFAVAGAIGAATLWRRPAAALPWAFVAIGNVVIAATEFVFVADDLRDSPWERMNTVFKFYLQAWTLLAVAAALLLLGIFRVARARPGAGRVTTAALGFIAQPSHVRRAALARRLPRERQGDAARACAWLAVAIMALGLAYPVAATPARLDRDMPSSPSGLSLDGYAWMNGGTIVNATGQLITFSDDLAAIEWFNAQDLGTPTILEAAIGPYRGNGSRISSATGLPAVLGWDHHQTQQRYAADVARRMSDIRALYNQTDPAAKLQALWRYNVRYVVVGDVERYWNTSDDTRPYASPSGLQAFDALVGRGLSVAFDSGATRVYRVDDFPRIPPAPGALHRR